MGFNKNDNSKKGKYEPPSLRTTYNKLKHLNLFEASEESNINIKDATLEIVIYSLASLYTLILLIADLENITITTPFSKLFDRIEIATDEEVKVAFGIN